MVKKRVEDILFEMRPDDLIMLYEQSNAAHIGEEDEPGVDISVLERILELHPGHPLVSYQLALQLPESEAERAAKMLDPILEILLGANLHLPDICKIYENANRLDVAIRIAEQHLSENRGGNYRQIISKMIPLASLYSRNNEKEKADKLYGKVLKLTRAEKEKELDVFEAMFPPHYQIARHHLRYGEDEKAYDMIREAMDWQGKDRIETSITNDSIEIFRHTSDYRFYEKRGVKLEHYAQLTQEQRIYLRMGILFNEIGQREKAQMYFGKAAEGRDKKAIMMLARAVEKQRDY